MEFKKLELTKKWYKLATYTVYDENGLTFCQVNSKSLLRRNFELVKDEKIIGEISSTSIFKSAYSIDIFGVEAALLEWKLSFKERYLLKLENGLNLDVISSNWGKKFVFKNSDEELAVISSKGGFKNNVGVVVREDLNPLIVIGSWIAIKVIKHKRSIS